MPDANLLLEVQGAATLLMTGLIWFVQIVHYPLMSRAASVRFDEFSRLHQQRTTWVVAGPMLIEAGSCGILWLQHPGVASQTHHVLATLILIAIWISTLLLQMPLHARLLTGKDQAVIKRLVCGNWLRTIGWTARGILLTTLPL